MTTLDIGLDVDGVLYPFGTVIARYIERRKGLPPGALDDHPTTWHWYRDQWGMDDDEFLWYFAEGVHEQVIFTEGDPNEGSLAAARRLHEAGHRIHYVTSRVIPRVNEGMAYLRTYDWLTRNGFPIDSLTVSADKGVVQTDVFLDDRPKNVSDLAAGGHPFPVIWDRPHNRAARDYRELFGEYPRVTDWHEFDRLVDHLARAKQSAAA